MKNEKKQGRSFFDAKRISQLFDFQHFTPNDRMIKIINDVESRYGTVLSDEALSYVSAAGEVDPVVPSDNISDSTEEAPL